MQANPQTPTSSSTSFSRTLSDPNPPLSQAQSFPPPVTHLSLLPSFPPSPLPHHAPSVDVQDLQAARLVRESDLDVHLQPPGPQQSIIDHVLK